MSIRYGNLEWVSPEASGRRGGYWRKVPDTRTNPTLAQAQHRLAFSETALLTRGLKGTVNLPDGREVSRSAIALGDMLKGSPDQSNITQIPLNNNLNSVYPRIKGAVVSAQPMQSQNELLHALINYTLAEKEKREKLNAEYFASLGKREFPVVKLREEREHINSSQKSFEERIKRLDSYIAKQDAAWENVKRQLDSIKRKLEEKQAPSVTKVPDTPHDIQDLSPPPSESGAWWHVPAILGSFLLGTVTVAYGLQGPKQANTVRNALCLVRQIANTKLQ